MSPVPLCMALESVRIGDRIPVLVSGIYAVDFFFDPHDPSCSRGVTPITCLEFSPSLDLAQELVRLHTKTSDGRVAMTVEGILFGPPNVPPILPDPDISVRKLMILRNSTRTLYCGNRFRTKLLVTRVVSFSRVEADVPFPVVTEHDSRQPVPLKMALPRYPAMARKLDYSGTVLVKAHIEKGEVTSASVEFGDPLLIEEAVSNIKTWHFAKGLTEDIGVTYVFELEPRSVEDGKGLQYQIRPPTYIKVTAPFLR